MRRAAALLAALTICVAGLAGCGGGDRGGKQVRVDRTAVGSGATGAYVFRRADLRGRRLPVVLFAHGWGAIDPGLYDGWIAHLAREGNEVIYPTYQGSLVEPPARVLGNMLLGVRRALRAAPVDPSSLVAVGHSAGGALIADYAGAAPALGLPLPRAIMPVYPGRAIGSGPALVREVPGSRIPSSVRMLVLASARDDVVGTRWARRIYRTASRVPVSRRRLRILRNPAVTDHRAPLLDSPAARGAFWIPLDRVIRQARTR